MTLLRLADPRQLYNQRVQPLSRKTMDGAGAAPRTIAGRYRVEQHLGSGGAAEVLQVTDTSTGQQLALKRLNDGVSSRLASLFELEFQTLASLQHAHTVRVFEFGRDEDTAFYTMELLEGQELKGLAPMPWHEVCAALRDAAGALSVLHARGLLHRDVSPKNLWRSPDGSIKLIDFGAITGFGPAEFVIGTPPFMAPELVNKAPLDPRSDLYALGATGYFLLTGVHAFPAHEIAELQELWNKTPLPPSAVLQLLGLTEVEPIPAELDALILALLRDDPLARPSSSAELIDRLSGLLGPEKRRRSEAPELLKNVAFVGRARERKRLSKLLRLASQGHGQSALIEASAGMGRTRILQELALEARVSNTVVLFLDATSHPEQWAGADALAHKLLDALPEDARAAAAPYAAALAHVSPQLAARVNVAADRPPEIAGELRVRVQAALRDWLLAVARDHTLVLLVDGLERADDGTAAFLLALSQACSTARILLVCTQLAAQTSAAVSGAFARAFRGSSRSVSLRGLSEAESFALVSSVFGSAPHLARLVNHLQQRTQGCPGHLLELAASLVRSDVIRFFDGTWVLPQELPQELLSKSREAMLLSRLDLLAAPVREIARLLSVGSGTLQPELCQAASGAAPSVLHAALDQLCEHAVMLRTQDGLRFAHELLREQLLSELTPPQRRAAELALGRYLQLRAASPFDRLRAAVHLLEGGDLSAAPLVTRAAVHITLHEPDRLAPSTALIERALPLLTAAGYSDAALAFLLAPLAIAGYFVERRFATQYGDQALSTLAQTFELGRVPRLARFIGPRLALILVLCFACFRYSLRGNAVPKLQDALVLLFMTSAALAASHALCYDYDNGSKAAQLLAPFAVLGDGFAPGFSYGVGCTLAEGVRDDLRHTYTTWLRTVELLESTRPILGLPQNLRVRYLSGLLFGLGIAESLFDNDLALQKAERVDQMGVALYPMNTDQLRAIYYAHRGDSQRYQHYKDCSEQRAIQQGAIWQNETWSLVHQTIVSHRYHDALGAKRAAEQLQIASETAPTLSVFANRSRGAYLLLRERYTEALPWLTRCLEEPLRCNFTWCRAHGALARAYNELGRHAEARAACERVLSLFTKADLMFPGLTLLLECEYLVARAGVGDLAWARGELARMLAEHVPHQGPLTNGELYETGLRIELLAGDEAAAQVHCENMALWYKKTRISSLIQHCERQASRLEQVFRPGHFHRALSLRTTAANTNSELRSITAAHPEQRCARALALLVKDAGCEQGYYFSIDPDGSYAQRAAYGGSQPDETLRTWLEQRVAAALREATTTFTTMSGEDAAPRDLYQLELRDARYRAIPVFGRAALEVGVIGMVVLATRAARVPAFSPALLAAMTQHLQVTASVDDPPSSSS